MKQVNLPIPTGWKVFFQEIYRRCYDYLYRQINSPWTKLAVLVMLTVLFTRKELSFSISIAGPDLFAVHESSVFTSSGAGPQVYKPGTGAKLASYTPAKRNWTAKQLRQLEYVKQYKKVALEEMALHGIPASITLAQGLLESGTGQSTLATRNNNHFGIKCFSKQCAKGHCSNHSDDHHKDFFRTYDNPEESYRSHSTILKNNRYRKLFTLDITDYKNWAKGLRKAGYATDPKYADKLIHLIRDLELYNYDR